VVPATKPRPGAAPKADAKPVKRKSESELSVAPEPVSGGTVWAVSIRIIRAGKRVALCSEWRPSSCLLPESRGSGPTRPPRPDPLPLVCCGSRRRHRHSARPFPTTAPSDGASCAPQRCMSARISTPRAYVTI